MSLEFTWEPVAPTGTVFSFTIVRRAMVAGSESSVPFAVVLVSLDDAPGVTFITNLLDDEQTKHLAIGARVRLVFEDVEAGLRMPYAVIETAAV